MLARDELLLRPVRIEPCDPMRARRLRALAKADSPHLQAVYEVDEAEDRAIIEQPDGVAWGARELDDTQRLRALSELRSAVEHMHTLGVTHGAITSDSVRVGEGRTVLLLPPGIEDPHDRDADMAALAAL